MPLYTFECEKCSNVTEQFVKEDDVNMNCCLQPMKKMFPKVSSFVDINGTMKVNLKTDGSPKHLRAGDDGVVRPVGL